jgi:hypothetical protein
VSLACSTYLLPPRIAGIAIGEHKEMWNRERLIGNASGWWSRVKPRPEVNTATYKTTDYMLGSVQDYRPGEKGDREHIWQATLGPDAIVYVNHPANSNESDARSPGAWLGNRILPRVAQWRDALIAIYRLPEDDWMGFTHAYFPVHAFDEYRIHDGWAFARKGDGYLALTAAQGIELTRKGPSAYRELRSYGRKNVWLCLMGRALTDGSFEKFQGAVLALDAGLEGVSARTTTLRGQTLSFGWTGPLGVDGKRPAIGKGTIDKRHRLLVPPLPRGNTRRTLRVQPGSQTPRGHRERARLLVTSVLWLLRIGTPAFRSGMPNECGNGCGVATTQQERKGVPGTGLGLRWPR